MIKRHIFTGFLTGIAANIGGVMAYIGFFSQRGIDATLANAAAEDYLGSIIALGAILNFIPFFIFLRKQQHYHARGVLLATLTGAIAIAIQKFVL